MTTPSTPTSTMKEAERLVEALIEAVHIQTADTYRPTTALLAFIRSLVEAQPCAVAGEAPKITVLNALQILERMGLLHTVSMTAEQFLRRMGEANLWVIDLPALAAPSAVLPLKGEVPIPPNVFWAPLAGNFYDAEGKGQGVEFYRRWHSRRDEFPQGESWGWGPGSAHNPFKAAGEGAAAPSYDTRQFSNLSNQAHGFARPLPGGVPTGLSDEQPVAHVHSNGDFCADRQIVSSVWPVPLYVRPATPGEPTIESVWLADLLHVITPFVQMGAELSVADRAIAVDRVERLRKALPLTKESPHG